MLFSKKDIEFRSFINYAPYAKGMPKEAPGRVAYYIGYKMVNEYMDNNEIDIEELMYLKDSIKDTESMRILCFMECRCLRPL